MLAMVLLVLLQPSTTHPVSEIIGTWQGTSTCADRVAAPACNDEVIVYDVTAGAASGVAHQKAYKIVNGERELMGEMDFTYSAADGCWRAEFSSPRVTSIWCLSVTGKTMTGAAWLMPGRRVVRAVRAGKQ